MRQILKKWKGKYFYSDSGIVFHEASSWSFGNDFARNTAIFYGDNDSSSHIDDLTNIFIVLGEGPNDGINDSSRTAEKKVYY